MDYKDFIKPNERVVYIADLSQIGWWCEVENCIVKIGEYSPYYTDGSADPTPEEYNEYCYVEAYPESEIVGESQFRLADLHPIQKTDKEISILYGTERGKLIGKVLEEEYVVYGDCLKREWNESEYSVIEIDGEWKVVESEDIMEERCIYNLSEDELKKLRTEIRGGSIYTTDYKNSLGVHPDVVCDAYDDFWSSLEDEYGYENAEEHDTPEEFAYFVMA